MRETQLSQVKVVNAQGEHFLTLIQREQYVYAKWEGHITADDVIKAAKTFLEFMQEHPTQKLLNDKSNVTGDWQDANDWLQFDWLPKVYAAGLRCIAHVYSYSMFSQLAANDLQKRIKPLFPMKNFINFDTAEEWVLNCDTSTPATNEN